MTTSNARKLTAEKRITMTSRVIRRNPLAVQKLAGMLMLVLVAVAVSIGGDCTALLVISPLALAAVFSKEKLLDFGIFSNKIRYYR